MIDRSSQYLNLLQTGYRIEEYSVTGTASGLVLPFAPFNSKRVLIYMSSINVGSSSMHIKMESGLLVFVAEASLTQHIIFTTALHFSQPSFEYVVNDVDVGLIFSGFGIIKN